MKVTTLIIIHRVNDKEIALLYNGKELLKEFVFLNLEHIKEYIDSSSALLVAESSHFREQLFELLLDKFVIILPRNVSDNLSYPIKPKIESIIAGVIEPIIALSRSIHISKSDFESDEDRFKAKLKFALIKRLKSCDVTVKNLANDLFIGYAMFYRKVKDTTGLTPKQYIDKFRMERALNLVKRSSTKLYEVSLSLGYKNQKHFSTAFFRYHGFRPSSVNSEE